MKTATLLVIAILVVFAGALTACSGGDSATAQKEIAKQRSGDYTVLLLSDTGQLKQGENTYTLEFRKISDNSLVDVGEVQASTQMPMPGMPNMIGDTTVTPSGTPGRYTVKSSLQMKGSWTGTFTFGTGQRVQFAIKAQ